LGAHEYMAPCPAGEDEIALAPGYAANAQVALRDPDVRKVDDRYVRAGEQLSIEPAIEVGNIFMLGTRYSEPLGARYLDERGDDQFVWMGSYGIGPARIVAAAVEQFSDEHGISWPRALAPFAAHLVVIGGDGSPGRPLRPWTVPNAIGFARLALIPAFLVSAFSSAHGTGALPATLFAVIGWGDYADGIAARLTRQYSRLGALMDPFTDRLLVVSGV